MADALEMRENGHARFALHTLDQAAAATRDDDVQSSSKALQHFADGSAIGGRHKLDGFLRKFRGSQALDEACMDGARRIQRIRAAAQDDGVAGLEAEGACIGRHVGTALVDNADNAKWRPDAFDMQAIGTIPFGDHFADRVAKVRDGTNAIGHVAHAGRGQFQAVEQGRRKPGFLAIAHISRVGFKDRLLPAKQRFCHGNQGGMLAFGRGDGELPGGGASLAAEFRHEGLGFLRQVRQFDAAC